MKATMVIAALAAAVLVSGCDRTATDREQAQRGGTSGQTAAGGATGQASEGSTNDRKAPARPSSPTSPASK